MSKKRIASFIVLVMFFNVFLDNIFYFTEYGIVQAAPISNGGTVFRPRLGEDEESLEEEEKPIESDGKVLIDGIGIDEDFYQEGKRKNLNDTKIKKMLM